MMSTLKIVIASTRPGRLGAPIGHWLADRARLEGAFDRVEVLDLAEMDLRCSTSRTTRGPA